MKITINGAGVTPAAVSLILADLEKEYGLKVRDLTMYVRFADENGRVVEPKLPGRGKTELVMTVNEPAEPNEPQTPKTKIFNDEKLSDEELQETFKKVVALCDLHKISVTGKGQEKIAFWLHDLNISFECIENSIELMLCKAGFPSMAYLDKLICHRASKATDGKQE